MGPGFDDAAEIAVSDAARGQVIPDQVVTGVRSRLVVCPCGAAQVVKRTEMTIGMDHDIGVINRPFRISRMLHYRSRE